MKLTVNILRVIAINQTLFNALEIIHAAFRFESMIKKSIRLAFSLAILVFVSGHAQDTYTYTIPIQLNDGLETSHFKKFTTDSLTYYNLAEQLHTNKHQIHSILVLKDDKLIIEEYFNNAALDKPHDLRSVSKSVRSLLLGIAIDKGFIESVNDPIFKYLKYPKPEKNLSPLKDSITIKHLLTMSTGLDCNDFDKSSKGQEDRV